MYDVVVIGAGSAGSRTALRLAQAGHSVIVIERKSSLDEPVCCTGVIGWECLSSFGIAESLILRQANGARLFSPSGKLLRLSRSTPQAAIINRPALNAALGAAAQESGAEYTLGAEVTEISLGSEAVRVKAEHGSCPLVIEARAAVLASGLSARFARVLGLGRVADSVAGVQAEVMTSVDEVELYFGRDIAPGFFAWLVPTRGGGGLAGMMSRRNAVPHLNKFLARLAAEGKITPAEAPLRSGVIPLKPLPRTYAARLLVVGDAAGQVKPTTGGGVYFGLICADIAAGVLDAALQADDLSAGRLAVYQREWKRRLGREMKAGYWARRLFERLDDRGLEHLFDIMHAGLAEALVNSDELSFDWQSRGIMKAVGNAALAGLLGVIKFPFR